MKTLLTTLLLFILSQKTFSQENSLLVGKWKTVEVSAKDFTFHRNDSIEFPEKFKTRSKVSLQDRRANIKTTYSENIFVFTGESKFFLYRNENPRTILFDGEFNVQNGTRILFNVKNTARQNVETTAEYYLKDGELYLKMYAENNGPVNYILKKDEN